MSGDGAMRPGEEEAIMAAAVALAEWQLGPLAGAMNDEAKKLIVERAAVAVFAAYDHIAAASVSVPLPDHKEN